MNRDLKYFKYMCPVHIERILVIQVNFDLVYVTAGLLNLYLHLKYMVSKRNKYENICKFRKKLGRGLGAPAGK